MFLLKMALLLFVLNSAWAESFCIAHKGSFKSSPENSLDSIQEALALNADGVEFDIRHTLDGEAILMHDRKLTKATHGPGKNCPIKTPIRELLAKDISENCVLDWGQRNIPVSTLAEALELSSASGKFVFVELKDEPSPKTAELLFQYFHNQPEKLRIISFKASLLDTLYRLGNGRKEFWSKVKSLNLDVTPFGDHEKYGINVWNRLLRLRSAEHYRRLKVETSVWTLNKESRIRKFIKQGIKFITTDEVEMCLSLNQEIQK